MACGAVVVQYASAVTPSIFFSKGAHSILCFTHHLPCSRGEGGGGGGEDGVAEEKNGGGGRGAGLTDVLWNGLLVRVRLAAPTPTTAAAASNDIQHHHRAALAGFPRLQPISIAEPR